jgi:hypothetical protein
MQDFGTPMSIWVNRVTLTVRHSLPIFTAKRTFSEWAGTSQRCQDRTLLLLLTSLQWVAGPASFRPASVCQGRVQLFGSWNRAHFLHAHRRAAGTASIRRRHQAKDSSCQSWLELQVRLGRTPRRKILIASRPRLKGADVRFCIFMSSRPKLAHSSGYYCPWPLTPTGRESAGRSMCK